LALNLNAANLCRISFRRDFLAQMKLIAFVAVLALAAADQENKVNPDKEVKPATRAARALRLIPLRAHVPINQWPSYRVKDPFGPGTYAFGYEVNDPGTRNVQFRDEERLSDGTVQGRYGLVLPTGEAQVTEYVGDQNGFRSNSKKIKSVPVVDVPIIQSAPASVVTFSGESPYKLVVSNQPRIGFFSQQYSPGKSPFDGVTNWWQDIGNQLSGYRPFAGFSNFFSPSNGGSSPAPFSGFLSNLPWNSQNNALDNQNAQIPSFEGYFDYSEPQVSRPQQPPPQQQFYPVNLSGGQLSPYPFFYTQPGGPPSVPPNFGFPGSSIQNFQSIPNIQNIQNLQNIPNTKEATWVKPYVEGRKLAALVQDDKIVAGTSTPVVYVNKK